MQPAIVIASVLKPVNDTRMFEKMAVSLSSGAKYKIFIVGFRGGGASAISNIEFVPLFNFQRLSLKRIVAPLAFLFKMIKLKPRVIIVNTHELLGVAIFYKFISRCKVIYDVRENYSLNIYYGKRYPFLIRTLLAGIIRLQEMITSVFIDQFFLAEKSYARELPFPGKKFLVLENKVSSKSIDTIKISRSPGALDFLICGTLSTEYGIFEGIKFYKKVKETFEIASLHISGYCPDLYTWKKIAEAIEGDESISVDGGRNLISHADVLQAIANANFILMPYQNLPQINNCFPTKIYEAVALKCPVIISSHGLWKDFIVESNAGVCIDFETADYKQVMTNLLSQQFYSPEPPASISWEDDEDIFRDSVSKFL